MGTRRKVCVFCGCVRGLRLVLELQQRRGTPAVTWVLDPHVCADCDSCDCTDACWCNADCDCPDYPAEGGWR